MCKTEREIDGVWISLNADGKRDKMERQKRTKTEGEKRLKCKQTKMNERKVEVNWQTKSQEINEQIGQSV